MVSIIRSTDDKSTIDLGITIDQGIRQFEFNASQDVVSDFEVFEPHICHI